MSGAASSNGGTAVDFGVIAGCDGLSDGHVGMNYSLPSRELICDSCEAHSGFQVNL